MEPFGLFQFLQSLLQNPPAKAEQTEESREEIPSEKSQETTPKPNNDAYLQFISNHERRAQGVRKK